MAGATEIALSRPRSLAAQMARMVACTATGGCDAMASATHWARSRSSAAGHTSLTSPMRCAVSAVMRSWLPSSDSRRISPSGMRWSIFIGS